MLLFLQLFACEEDTVSLCTIFHLRFWSQMKGVYKLIWKMLNYTNFQSEDLMLEPLGLFMRTM